MTSALFNGTSCPFIKCSLNFASPYDLIAHLEGQHCSSPPLPVIENEQNKFVRPNSIYSLFPDGFAPEPVAKPTTKLNFESYKKRTTSVGALALSRMRGSESERTDDGEEGDAAEEEKKYRCNVEGCDKRYKNLQGVKYHMRSAHGKADEISVGGLLRVEGGAAAIMAMGRDGERMNGGGGIVGLDGSLGATVGQVLASNLANSRAESAAAAAAAAGAISGGGGSLLSLSSSSLSLGAASGLAPPTPTKYAMSRPHKCPHCCKRYKTTSGLTNHLTSAHDNKLKAAAGDSSSSSSYLSRLAGGGSSSTQSSIDAAAAAAATTSAVNQSVHEILARTAKEVQAQEAELREQQQAILEGKSVATVLQSGLAQGPGRHSQLRNLITQQQQQQPMQQDNQPPPQQLQLPQQQQQQQQGYYQQQPPPQPQQPQPQPPQQQQHQYIPQRTVRDEMMEKMELSRGGGGSIALPPLNPSPQRRIRGPSMNMQYREDLSMDHQSTIGGGGGPSTSMSHHHQQQSHLQHAPPPPQQTSTVRLLPPADELLHRSDMQQHLGGDHAHYRSMGGPPQAYHHPQQQQMQQGGYNPRGMPVPVSAGYHHQQMQQQHHDGYSQQQQRMPYGQDPTAAAAPGDYAAPSPRPLPSITSSFTSGGGSESFQYAVAAPPMQQYPQQQPMQQGYQQPYGDAAAAAGYGGQQQQPQHYYEEKRSMEHHDYAR